MACARNAMCAIFDSTRETWGACLTYAGRPSMEAGSGLERWILWQLGASITTSKKLEECLPRDTCLIIEDLGLDRPLSEHPAANPRSSPSSSSSARHTSPARTAAAYPNENASSSAARLFASISVAD